MKRAILALFILLPITAIAVEKPLAFTDVKIECPQLSIVDNSLNKAPVFFNELGREGPVSASGRVIVVSRMPVLAPKSNFDSKMVKAPDLSIDYKLIISAPLVVQSK
jgi:hypothetical protein